MKTFCFVLCFILIVFPLAACQANPAAETSEIISSDAGSVEVMDADFSRFDGAIPQNSVMGRVTMIDGYTVTVETVGGFGFPGAGSMPEAKDFDGAMPAMPGGGEAPPEMPKGEIPPEMPKMDMENRPDGAEMKKPADFEDMPFEPGGFGESREFSLENAEILIESQDGQVAGSIEDISVGSMLNIELDDENKTVKVLVMSDTGDIFGNMPFNGGKQENGKDAQ